MPKSGDGRDGWTIQIEGREPVVLSRDTVEGPEWILVQKTMGYECASGDWIEGEWTGVPVLELLEAADVPGDTTHVQLESVDGYLACVGLLDLGEAIVAIDGGEFPDQREEPVEEDDGTDDGNGEGTRGTEPECSTDEFPRFVAPRILGPRTMKNLARIRPLALDPHEDRESYEELPIDSE